MNIIKKLMMNQNQTITEIANNVKLNGKKALYLVLKPKNFADDIIDSIQDDVEKRFNTIYGNMIQKLNKMEFDDYENSIKYILMRKYIVILDQILDEIKINLSPKDKNIIDSELEKEKKDNENKNKNHNNRLPIKDHNSNYSNGRKYA